MKAFPLNFLVGGGFLLADSFHRFSGEKPGGLHKISVCGRSPYGEIEWRSLCFTLFLFFYLFIICLFIVFLCVCFFFTLRELFIGSCINVWGGGGGGISVKLCGGFGGLVLAYFVLLWV